MPGAESTNTTAADAAVPGTLGPQLPSVSPHTDLNPTQFPLPIHAPALGLLDVIAILAIVLAALLLLALLVRPGKWKASLPAVVGGLVGALCGVATYAAGFMAILLSDTATPAFRDHDIIQQITYLELILAAVGAACGAIFAKYRWRSLGVLSYVGLVSLVAGYLLYAVTAAIPRVPSDQRWLSYVLLAAEAGSLTLVLIFAFYSLDVASRKSWVRLPEQLPRSRRYVPKVAIHIPMYNEPLDLTTITVARLMAQDYPKDRFVVMVLDDSSDEATRNAMQAFCRKVGARYLHRPDRRGFKAGALNYALRRTPRDVELITVVDADYWVEPEYLRSTVGYFVAPRLGFLQTPQDYRNIEESFLTKQYYNAEAYFYHAVLPSRNEENAIIFCGTMGLLRRRALEQAGGWGEEHVCEDAELSVRLAALGWDSLYVGKSFGKGLMPAVFDAYKKQFHRWSFGNVRILFSHLGGILSSRMSRRQKFDFVAGNLHWFDGVFITAIALSLIYVAVGEAVGIKVVTHHQRELALLALVPMFLLVDGVSRTHLALSRAGKVRFRDTLRVLGMWFAIKFTNMSAALKATIGMQAAFVRTPKAPGAALKPWPAFLRALTLTKGESLFATVLASVAVMTVVRALLGKFPADQLRGGALLAFWLAMYALMFACAPLYAYLSYRTLKPLPSGAPLLGNLQPGNQGFEVLRGPLGSRLPTERAGSVAQGDTVAAVPLARMDPPSTTEDAPLTRLGGQRP